MFEIHCCAQLVDSQLLVQIVKNLTAVQRTVGHLRSESFSSLGNIGENSKEVPEEFVLDEDGQRRYVSGNAADDRDVEDGTSLRAYLDGNIDLATETSMQEESEIWLRRQGVDKALVQGLGKGPDGIALAKVAAKRLRGIENSKLTLSFAVTKTATLMV